MAVSVKRYIVNSKTIIGQVTPFFLRGRRILRFLSAIAAPLDSVNKAFQKWAYSTLIDAATTSQVIILKWSLKHKLSLYLQNPEDEFMIDTYDRSNYATLYEDELEQHKGPEVKDIFMSEGTEDQSFEAYKSKRVVLRDKEELTSESNEILFIAPPHNSRITEEQYRKRIKQHIETYLVYDVEYRITISKSNKQ